MNSDNDNNNSIIGTWDPINANAEEQGNATGGNPFASDNILVVGVSSQNSMDHNTNNDNDIINGEQNHSMNDNNNNNNNNSAGSSSTVATSIATISMIGNVGARDDDPGQEGDTMMVVSSTPYNLFESVENEIPPSNTPRATTPSPPFPTFHAATTTSPRPTTPTTVAATSISNAPIVVEIHPPAVEFGSHHHDDPPDAYYPVKDYSSNGNQNKTLDDNNYNNHHNNNYKQFDEMSLTSHKTFSTTDGVDIVFGASPLSSHPTNFVEWNQSFAGRIVRDKRFKRTVIACILLNSLVLGLMTFEGFGRRLLILLDTLDTAFLMFFTFELGLQVMYYSAGGWQHVLQQGWLLFDILIVGLSLFCNVLLVLRAFRVIRTLRLATRVEELRVLAVTLLKIFPKMLAMLVLMLLLFYIFAVMFTFQFRSLHRDGLTMEDYFSRLDKTAFTLFTMMTLDGWSSVAREVMAVHTWAWTFFVSFVLVSVVVVFHLLMAVGIEAALSLYEERIVRIRETPSMQSQQQLMHASKTMDNHALSDVARLEQKLDELTNTMKRIMERQVMLQDMMVLQQWKQTDKQQGQPEVWENEPKS